jgi:hypothetical protein
MGKEILPLIGAVATVTAAFIAAIIALVNLINAKDQKTTEFRQQWINSLRSEIGKFSSSARYIATAIALKRRFDPLAYDRDPTAADALSDQRAALQAAYYMSVLHFNLNDTAGQELIKKLESVVTQLKNPGTVTLEKVLSSLEGISQSTRVILKNEWERVKNGETSYVLTKRIAFVSAAIFLCAGGFLLLKLA